MRGFQYKKKIVNNFLILIFKMQDEWRKEGKDVRLVLYHVLATGPVAGIIEVKLNSILKTFKFVVFLLFLKSVSLVHKHLLKFK